MATNNGDVSPIEIQEHLEGIDYPVGKKKLIQQARDQDAPDHVLNVLNEIDDRDYDSPIDVTKAVGEVE